MSLTKNIQQSIVNDVLNEIGKVSNNTNQPQNQISTNGNENTNIGEVTGDVNFYANGIPIEQAEVFSDPTETFTLQEGLTPLYIKEEELQECLQAIYQERIVFLGGKSSSNVMAILHSIIKKYQSDTPQEHRRLSFWDSKNAQRNIYLSSIKEDAFPQDALVTIDIRQNKASNTFLKSIVEMSAQDVVEIKNTLKEKNLAIICYVQENEQIQELTKQSTNTFGFHFWDTSPPINTIKEFIEQFNYTKLYDKDHSVFKYILYVATFFPRTSPKEFKKIVDVLLSEKKDEILADATREMSDKDEILKRTEQLRTRSLLYLWEQETDTFFKNCGLAIAQDNELQKVDFKDERDREAYKVYFKNKFPFFLLEQFDNLINSGLPFASETSNQIIEYFIQISCELAKNDPHFYGTKLLHKVSNLFKEFAENENAPTDIVSALQMFLVELVYAMLKLNNTLLTERIEFFLYEHLDYRYSINKAPRNLLADITFELRFMDGFNKYHWIEQMIKLGKKEAKTSAYHLLLRLVNSYKENPQELRNFFEEGIYEWLPISEKNIPWEQLESQDGIESYALSLIIDYWGFYQLDQSNILADINPHFLVSWLFNTNLEVGYYNRSRLFGLRTIKQDGSKQGKALRLNEENTSRIIDKARAILTEVWFEKLASSPKMTNLCQKYVELFYQYTNDDQRSALIAKWDRQIYRYWTQANQLKKYGKPENADKIEEINAKKKSLQSLTKQFRKLCGVMHVRPKKGCFPFTGLLRLFKGILKLALGK